MKSDSYLCNSATQLLFALCNITQTKQPATLHYLSDVAPLSTGLIERLETEFPELTIELTCDEEIRKKFENLPQLFPAVLRRNRRWNGTWFETPMEWAKRCKGPQAFRSTYTYNTGFFCSKVISGISGSMVLREAGLNNYARRPMPPLKRVARFWEGYCATTQTMGDEKWITSIEVSAPEDLPSNLSNKVVKFDVLKQMNELSPDDANRIARVFGPDFPSLRKARQPIVLLTQPLDQIGMCSREEKINIYQELVDDLTSSGLEVFTKNHPYEITYALEGASSLKHQAPIELWHLVSAERFTAGVALCSASLFHTYRSFCDEPIQLVDRGEFTPDRFSEWRNGLSQRLANNLSRLSR